MNNVNTTFAFKLAASKTAANGEKKSKWAPRKGLTAQGCTPVQFGNYRAASKYNPDGGIYC